MPVSKTFTREDLSRYSHLPLNEVAKELGVCVTILKRICRRQGIKRWPYRKVRSLEKSISSLEEANQRASGLEKQRLLANMQVLKSKCENLRAFRIPAKGKIISSSSNLDVDDGDDGFSSTDESPHSSSHGTPFVTGIDQTAPGQAASPLSLYNTAPVIASLPPLHVYLNDLKASLKEEITPPVRMLANPVALMPKGAPVTPAGPAPVGLLQLPRWGSTAAAAAFGDNWTSPISAGYPTGLYAPDTVLRLPSVVVSPPAPASLYDDFPVLPSPALAPVSFLPLLLRRRSVAFDGSGQSVSPEYPRRLPNPPLPLPSVTARSSISALLLDPFPDGLWPGALSLAPLHDGTNVSSMGTTPSCTPPHTSASAILSGKGHELHPLLAPILDLQEAAATDNQLGLGSALGLDSEPADMAGCKFTYEPLEGRSMSFSSILCSSTV